MQNVQSKVIGIIITLLGSDREEVTLESDLMDDLGADSLDVVELMMKIEQEFKIHIPDEKAEEIKTVGDIVNYINDHFKK